MPTSSSSNLDDVALILWGESGLRYGVGTRSEEQVDAQSCSLEELLAAVESGEVFSLVACECEGEGDQLFGTSETSEGMNVDPPHVSEQNSLRVLLGEVDIRAKRIVQVLGVGVHWWWPAEEGSRKSPSDVVSELTERYPGVVVLAAANGPNAATYAFYGTGAELGRRIECCRDQGLLRIASRKGD